MHFTQAQARACKHHDKEKTNITPARQHLETAKKLMDAKSHF
jgi:hypothetical protein